jgi:hypothetical protein
MGICSYYITTLGKIERGEPTKPGQMLSFLPVFLPVTSQDMAWHGHAITHPGTGRGFPARVPCGQTAAPFGLPSCAFFIIFSVQTAAKCSFAAKGDAVPLAPCPLFHSV